MKDSFWSTTFWTISIALMIGAGSGILATSYTSSYLSDYALELSKLTAPLRLAQSEPKLFPSSLEDAVYRFTMNDLPSIVDFYPSVATQPFGYRSQDVVASGLILTSDGWIMAPLDATVKYLNLVVMIGDHAYPVEKVVEDAQTQVVFMKVHADALNIVGFGSGLAVSVGEQVLVSGSAESLQVGQVFSVNQPQGVVTSSDVLSQTVTLNNSVHSPAYVFSLNGDLLGFVSQAGEQPQVIPAEAFLPAFRTLLETGEIHRASLGVSTVSIAQSVGLSEKTRRSKTVGALIPDRKALPLGSMADKAGLKPLDIILLYNNQPINAEQTLDRLVAFSKPGDEVTLHVDRAGEEIDVKVTLGEH